MHRGIKRQRQREEGRRERDREEQGMERETTPQKGNKVHAITSITLSWHLFLKMTGRCLKQHERKWNW